VKAATAHAVLRDRRHWLGTHNGLVLDRDGSLTLARVPAPADGRAIEVATAYPAPREVSGIALGPCDAVFVADTANGRILFEDRQCASQTWLPPGPAPQGAGQAPGYFDTPRALATAADALLVADAGLGRVQSLAFPGLEAHWAPALGVQPSSIAVDSAGRMLIVDAAVPRLRRFTATGEPDHSFNMTLAAQAMLAAPLFVAVGRDDGVLVSDTAANAVHCFDANGVFRHSLAGPAGWLPGALAAHAERIYVADAATGTILVFDDSGTLHGPVHGWKGPVTALAVHALGDLFIKPGLDTLYYRLRADAAYLSAGELRAGPFDAGEEQEWERAWAECTLPAGTQITIAAAQQGADTPVPTLADFRPLPGTDALLAPHASVPRRFLWLRISLASTDPAHSPRLDQARAATAAENYLDHLPATYRRHDGPDGFLTRWLQLMRGEFLAVEDSLEDMPRVGDPFFADATSLPWLAQWLAFELPRIADDGERRALLARAAALHVRRGSVDSIAGFVELHTGIRPAIVEGFADRRIWVLGESSHLDFDTQLPALDPLGMVVPDPDAADDCCPGPIGRAVVGETGPLATHQIGLPLHAPEAYRFCVVVDAYRLRGDGTLAELRRIVDREKPAHTDYRIDVVDAELRIGLQARIGIDAIVGGPSPGWQLQASLLDDGARLAPAGAAARIDDTVLDGSFTLT
jgi:phage tail-like protein